MACTLHFLSLTAYEFIVPLSAFPHSKDSFTDSRKRLCLAFHFAFPLFQIGKIPLIPPYFANDPSESSSHSV